MPLTYFRCPDKEKRPIKECLEHCPRKEGRCLRLPFLYTVGQDRQWRGKPSTTQLLNPVRMEYLKITCDYTIEPKQRAFAVLGTRHHYTLEAVGKKLEGIETEKYLDGDDTGITDLLEPDELKEGYWVVTDYKTWGSYSLAKILGISDSNGDYERRQTTLQLNNYRLKVEKLGFPVSRLLIQCTVRDGNTKTAYMNKINEPIQIIPIEIMDDDEVKEYFITKAYALISALKNQELPLMCPFEERWNGRRCSGYCDVAEFCPEGRKILKLE